MWFECKEGELIELVIKMPVKSFNLNQLTNTNRTNRYAAASQKKKVMREIYDKIKHQVSEMLEGKYIVHANWLVSSKNRDLDNLLLKNVFDCMQENGLLKNDNLNHIIEIRHTFEIVKRVDEGVVIKFEEI